MKLLLSVACCLLPFSSAAGQGLELRGTVRDPDARPIPGVEVRAPEARALTDSLGRFVLRGLAGDSARLELRRIGYQALTRTVSLRASPGPLELVMHPNPVVLPEVRTTARPDKPAKYLGTSKYDGFFQRQKLSIGNGDPTDADIRIPRCFGGSSKVTVWIDGKMQLPSSSLIRDPGHPGRDIDLAEHLARITPSNIEMVEVYRGASQIPGVFHWDGCAAIAIWTRYNRGADSSAGRPD